MPKLLPLPSVQADTSSACLVMVDLVGSTALAHALPLPHYWALMSEFVQVMILCLEARGGQVLQHQGDAVVGYWNACSTAEACQAALEAHDRAARLGVAGVLGVSLHVRAGIALGEVLTGMVGGQRSAYGLPVNYARRLCDVARPGETLVCGDVTQRLGDHFGVLRATMHDLRGFGAACPAFLLSWPTAAHMKAD